MGGFLPDVIDPNDTGGLIGDNSVSDPDADVYEGVPYLLGEGSLGDVGQDFVQVEPIETDDFRVTGDLKTLHDTIYEGTIFGGEQPKYYEDTVDVPGPGFFGDLSEGGANDPDDPRNADVPLLGKAVNWMLANPGKAIAVLGGLWVLAVAGPAISATATTADAIGGES